VFCVDFRKSNNFLIQDWWADFYIATQRVYGAVGT
jgi:hypothetical protein